MRAQAAPAPQTPRASIAGPTSVVAPSDDQRQPEEEQTGREPPPGVPTDDPQGDGGAHEAAHAHRGEQGARPSLTVGTEDLERVEDQERADEATQGPLDQRQREHRAGAGRARTARCRAAATTTTPERRTARDGSRAGWYVVRIDPAMPAVTA